MVRSLQQFITRYHQAVALSSGDRLERMKAEMASRWVDGWMEELGGPVEDESEFPRLFGEFLERVLGFADTVNVSIERDRLNIAVEGCCLCPGNDLLREQDEPTLCPILSTGLLAAKRVLGRKATLLGVERDTLPLGSCSINYRLVRRRPGRAG